MELKTEYKNIGASLAVIHNRKTPGAGGMVRLDGNFLYEKFCALNMPFYIEIQKFLLKSERIIIKITDGIPNALVKLWNADKGNNFYGNPAWDLGLVINSVKENSWIECFLREYLDNGGVQITISELYIGIMYAKLDSALSECRINEIKKVAENECSAFIQGRGLHFSEISGETLARLGLPGLFRV